jgi:hypothetical protein
MIFNERTSSIFRGFTRAAPLSASKKGISLRSGTQLDTDARTGIDGMTRQRRLAQDRSDLDSWIITISNIGNLQSDRMKAF